MAMIPPPEGLSAEDYDAIEAAVIETVRGRWFLAEYARRSRVDEVRQMLDGLARLEQTMREPPALPADPSIRLLVQRLKEISQTLETLAGDMRGDGVAVHYCANVATQARAVAGLLRGAPQIKLETSKLEASKFEASKFEVAKPAEIDPAPRPEPLPVPAAARAPVEPLPAPRPLAPPLGADRGGAALTRLDRLSTAEKVALFS
jgi:hypothetical protein